MDQKIFKELEEIKKLLSNVVAKNDLVKALSNHPTKEDLVKELSNHPTKEDLVKELSNHPTKEDLKVALEKQREVISEDFGEIINDLFVEDDKLKANRIDLETLEDRVEKLEQKIATIHV